ncbi:diguanylate cyclase [Selenihalanaerobacter shriftii]|uniref:Diguanylate cyclase (GGDEF) domain-containing protein n=1 Tax=Selenihalanaerobacter shriftii TaxID=142842 RepID=A0A1T4K6N5_9FIRM|nr:diguanylate cyclase [Selenihalanaerobacter shriftii]SJZ38082.1 diguanylate cyclase (GGDEF) domain-containing protein [Selenihalanaerobacter shriftii]
MIMKLKIILLIKVIMLIGAIYSVFQLDSFKKILFKSRKEISINDSLILIGLFSLTGIIGDILQGANKVLFFGIKDLGVVLAGLLGGPISGGLVAGIFGGYNFIINEQQINLINVANILTLGLVSGFFKIKLILEDKKTFKIIFFKNYIPISILYLLLTVNTIYHSNMSDSTLIFTKISLNLLGILLLLFLFNKLRKEETNKELNRLKIKKQDRKLNNLNRSLKKLDGLYKMGKEINSGTNLYQTLESIVKITCEALDVDSGGIITLEDDSNRICHKFLKNFNQKLIPEKIEEGIFEAIVEERQSIIKNNLDFNSELQFIKEGGYETFLATPLIENDEVIGILFVVNNTKFSNEDLDVLNRLASQASYLIKKNQLFEKMQRNVAELTTLQRISKTINSTLNLEQVLDLTIDVIVGTMGVSSCAVMLFDKDNKKLKLEASRGLLAKCKRKGALDIKACVFAKETLESKKPVVYNQVPQQIKEDLGMPEIKSAIAVPLKVRDEIIGVILAINTLMAHSFSKEDERFLTTLTNQVAIALENAKMYNRMEEIAIRDGLTQLYNHSYFQEALADEINRAKRYGQELSLILLDIDNFKDFNDTYGHQVGDKVLKELAKNLKSIIRDIDVVARYGGEEFVIILPATSTKGAEDVGFRINESVREMVVKDDGLELNVTVSIGVSTYNQALSQKEFISEADKALYRAKKEGKDRTCIA